MGSTIGDLLKSKKFLTAIVGTVLMLACYGLSKLGVNIDADKATEYIVILFTALLGGQGLADFGKAKAQIAADVVTEQQLGAKPSVPPSPPSSPK